VHLSSAFKCVFLTPRYTQYGEAAVVQSIVDRLPEIVESIAKPLSKVSQIPFLLAHTHSTISPSLTPAISQTDKMVFISQDGSSGLHPTRGITVSDFVFHGVFVFVDLQVRSSPATSRTSSLRCRRLLRASRA
jgi:hypothetical protein